MATTGYSFTGLVKAFTDMLPKVTKNETDIAALVTRANRADTERSENERLSQINASDIADISLNIMHNIKPDIATNTSKIATNTANIAAQRPTLSNKATSGIDTGYWRDPVTGFTMQWGKTGWIRDDASAVITYPRAFTNVFNVQATTSRGVVLGGQFFHPSVYATTNTSFSITNVGNANIDTEFFWLATGLS